MAYIRSYDTTQKRKGKTVKRYEVVWREPVRDQFGLPVPANPDHPDGPKRTRSRQESYLTREAAEARRDELNAAKHTSGTGVLADAKRAGELPFGHYARAWVESQRVKAASGKVKADTVDGYQGRLAVYALPEFGGKAIASITPAHCEQFLAALVARGMSPATLKHHWSTLRAVFVYAQRHKAITSNPVDGVDYSGNSAKRRNKRHHPLKAVEVAAVSASVGERYPVYELMTLFVAYTGPRAEEIAGLEVGDLVFTPGPDGVRARIEIDRAKKRKGGVWVSDTLKSENSRRTVPLPGWLAARMEKYLLTEHPSGNPNSPDYDRYAPLWPNRALGGARRRGCRAVAPLDYSEPVDPGAFYKNLLRPALEAVGLPASRPAAKDAPAVQGVRLHDLRHTAATLWLSSGVHFMQVSKWLGHSTYTLTLDVYGDWIPEEDGGAGNPLPEPATAKAKVAETPSNVVSLFERTAT
ncbi:MULTISPECIES: tyrosine-type recombinase/integrase [Mycobacterium]|uniref:Prophage integrase n=2 Tax=Mycobacterium TaxID=1763 RepID=A0A1Y0T1H4_MYCIT|nr:MULTISPECIES: site-specific integrase [Mycobacterium]AOS91784.1 site-specific integrase [Mycobacterium intracellulare subsp. chimaera]ARV81881.1 site-specific integrase [Mycobacterium intracellulare subsp. chimaera]ASL14691.1 prophage integrase [Mycobacterium intracellulare subsp. chimaera]ASL20780.1 prophage integrase [Mycobacterium intracellulare subsp. chimaera]ASQ85910.1 site-specific integrase [Mycobacterium intracellulare subsp. chimaera]